MQATPLGGIIGLASQPDDARAQPAHASGGDALNLVPQIFQEYAEHQALDQDGCETRDRGEKEGTAGAGKCEEDQTAAGDAGKGAVRAVGNKRQVVVEKGTDSDAGRKQQQEVECREPVQMIQQEKAAPASCVCVIS